MTDKQIIDGADCSYYDEGICWNEDVSVKYCAKCDYCYHKTVQALKAQLKAKEQECEELKIEAEKWESAFTLDTKMLDTADRRKNELEQQLDQLKAENEELKNKINSLICSENCYKYKQSEQLKSENEKLKEAYKKLNNMYNENCNYTGKVEQAIEKIKEIVKELDCKNPDECWENKPDWNGEVYGCEPDNWVKPSDLATCPSKLAHIILQICDEVKDV